MKSKTIEEARKEAIKKAEIPDYLHDLFDIYKDEKRGKIVVSSKNKIYVKEIEIII